MNGGLRIGELSRRVGVRPDLLRAWERRYAIVTPARSPAGYRLYSAGDERRIRRMKALVDEGLAPAEAARAAVVTPVRSTTVSADVAPGVLGSVAAELRSAMSLFDEVRAQEVFDRLLADHGQTVVIRDVVLPLLRDNGSRWAAGECSVAEEHFCTGVMTGRLRGLGQGWGQGVGPMVLLACPPGELHDLGLLCFGLAMRGQGWRIVWLGADTPFEAIAEAVALLRPALVVLSAVTAAPLRAAAEDLARLGSDVQVAIGGAGAGPAIALRTGARLLRDDPVTAAAEVSQGFLQAAPA